MGITVKDLQAWMRQWDVNTVEFAVGLQADELSCFLRSFCVGATSPQASSVERLAAHHWHAISVSTVPLALPGDSSLREPAALAETLPGGATARLRQRSGPSAPHIRLGAAAGRDCLPLRRQGRTRGRGQGSIAVAGLLLELHMPNPGMSSATCCACWRASAPRRRWRWRKKS